MSARGLRFATRGRKARRARSDGESKTVDGVERVVSRVATASRKRCKLLNARRSRATTRVFARFFFYGSTRPALARSRPALCYATATSRLNF
mmetsp:Transcript_4432/g.16952  ORF Transcript_4432/g.16952 Transcript_4432/m.16952 type:complete len:92 (+) Transcript_4432:468-743(+)